jgi:hypothetical protein
LVLGEATVLEMMIFVEPTVLEMMIFVGPTMLRATVLGEATVLVEASVIVETMWCTKPTVLIGATQLKTAVPVELYGIVGATEFVATGLIGATVLRDTVLVGTTVLEVDPESVGDMDSSNRTGTGRCEKSSSN